MNILNDTYYWCWNNLNPKDYYREVKWFLQRGVRGYDDRALWDIRECFGDTTLKVLKKFKKQYRNGYPAFLADKNTNQKQAEEKWEKILDAMIEGLDYITTDSIEQPIWKKYYEDKTISSKEYMKEQKRLYQEAEQKAMLFIKYLSAIWD